MKQEFLPSDMTLINHSTSLWKVQKVTYLYEYLSMPETEATRSLLWWFHGKKWELLWRFSDPCIAMELEIDALKSLLVPKPFVRIGRVVALRSFALRRRWACFLYHLMPQNITEAIKTPRAKPTEIPMITRSALGTIIWSLWKSRHWKHLARQIATGSLS